MSRSWKLLSLLLALLFTSRPLWAALSYLDADNTFGFGLPGKIIYETRDALSEQDCRYVQVGHPWKVLTALVSGFGQCQMQDKKTRDCR